MELTNEHKQVNRQLNILAFSLLNTELLLVVFGELDVLPNGVVPVSYGLQLVVVFLTIFLIPTSLKLLNWTPVRLRVEGKPCTYRCWAMTRLVALYIPVLLGTGFYYLMLDCSAIYWAIVSFIAVIFAWPTKDRLLDVVTPKEGKDEA